MVLPIKTPPKLSYLSTFTLSCRRKRSRTLHQCPKSSLGPNHYLLGIPESYPMWPPPLPYPSAPYPPGSHPVRTSGSEWLSERKGSPKMSQHPTSDNSDIMVLHLFQTIDELLTVLI